MAVFYPQGTSHIRETKRPPSSENLEQKEGKSKPRSLPFFAPPIKTRGWSTYQRHCKQTARDVLLTNHTSKPTTV